MTIFYYLAPYVIFQFELLIGCLIKSHYKLQTD
jgi:hypothetical protein